MPDNETSVKLVAAAPELLNMLKRLVQLRCMDGHNANNCDEVAKAVELINKVEKK